MKRTVYTSLAAVAASVALIASPAAAAPAGSPAPVAPGPSVSVTLPETASPTVVTSAGGKWLCKVFGIFCG